MYCESTIYGAEIVKIIEETKYYSVFKVKYCVGVQPYYIEAFTTKPLKKKIGDKVRLRVTHYGHFKRLYEVKR